MIEDALRLAVMFFFWPVLISAIVFGPFVVYRLIKGKWPPDPPRGYGG